MYTATVAQRELVAHGFPAAERAGQPSLNVEEFRAPRQQLIYVSATPGPYELTKAGRGGGADHTAHGLVDRAWKSGGERAGGRSVWQIRKRVEAGSECW